MKLILWHWCLSYCRWLNNSFSQQAKKCPLAWGWWILRLGIGLNPSLACATGKWSIANIVLMRIFGTSKKDFRASISWLQLARSASWKIQFPCALTPLGWNVKWTCKSQQVTHWIFGRFPESAGIHLVSTCPRRMQAGQTVQNVFLPGSILVLLTL